MSSTKKIKPFIEHNQPTWSKLEDLLASLGRKPSKKQIDQLGLLYRKISSHYAYAQTYFSAHEVTDYLKTLVIRSHNIIYGAKKKNQWKTIIQFFLHQFPQLFYQRVQFFLIALFLLATGFILAYFLTFVNDDYARIFLGNLTPLHPDEISKQQWNHAIASSSIMINNIYVAFFCFAWGALLGIGTVYALFLNGAMIGALAALYQKIGGNYVFWAHILPHGIIELTAIFIAGSAGLSLAYHFFVPGEQTRYQSFKKEGKVTIKLIFGVIPMFVLAAIIEGYLTPAPWPYWTKYLFAALTFTLLLLYFGRPFVKEGIIRTTEIEKETKVI